MFKSSIAHKLDSKPRTKDVLLSENENYDFTSMLLPPHILQGLSSAGFIRPSPIQLKAIPLARCGFDLVVQAKSGTGKTCVFSVTALENIISDSKRLQVIVLAPTREIAQQIQHVISGIGRYQKNLKVRTFIGGVPVSEDKVNLVDCQIAVGAPGRLRHLIEDGFLTVDAVRLVVLDEADKLLEESFQNDINCIFQKLPESKQVIACSATYTDEMLGVLENYMMNATHVTPGEEVSPLLIGLRHFVFIEPESFNNLSRLKTKEACLLKILKNVPFLQCLVFSNYHSRAESICNGLKNNGWKASWIAGKQDQQTRTNIMTNVKDLKVRVLVTTDLTARGIDLHEANLVINMDVPNDYQTYLHRMGRAGRYGGHGMVVTIITSDETRRFRRLLGAIGGSYASAFIIADCDLSDTLWSKDMSELEQIFGQPPDDDDDVNVDENSKNSCDDELKPMNGLDVMEGVSNEIDIIEDVYIKQEIESVDSTKNSSVRSDSASDFSGGHEKISDSDGEDAVEEMDEDVTEIEYDKAINDFGVKLLRYSSVNAQRVVRSIGDLASSLNDFTKCETIASPCKTVLEPSGTLEIEIVERFIKNFNNRYNSLIDSCRGWDVDKVVDILSNDSGEDVLGKILNNVKIDKESEKHNFKDLELHSRSSSSEEDSQVDESPIQQTPAADNVDEISTVIKKEDVDVKDENGKKRKPSSVYSNSASSVEEKSNLGKKVKNVYKKAKQTEDEPCDEVGVKGTVLFSRNKGGKGKVHKNINSNKCAQSNMMDGDTTESNSCFQNLDEDNNVNDMLEDSSEDEDVSDLNVPNETVFPRDVQNWYNMWHRQEAHLRWYLGYSQYLNYMLNPKK